MESVSTVTEPVAQVVDATVEPLTESVSTVTEPVAQVVDTAVEPLTAAVEPLRRRCRRLLLRSSRSWRMQVRRWRP